MIKPRIQEFEVVQSVVCSRLDQISSSYRSVPPQPRSCPGLRAGEDHSAVFPSSCVSSLVFPF